MPLAAVLWNRGTSFVVSFLFADLIILPFFNIYWKYYGSRAAAILGEFFFVATALAGYAVERRFGALSLIPEQRQAVGRRRLFPGTTRCSSASRSWHWLWF